MVSGDVLAIIVVIQGGVLFLLCIGLLGAFNQISHIAALQQQSPSVPSRIHKGDALPINLGFDLPPRAYVVFVMYGCSGCASICKKLDEVDLGNWSLIVVLSGPAQIPGVSPNGMPVVDGQEAEVFPFPRQAIRLYDPPRAWLRDLNIHTVPAALAFVGSRLVDQAAPPGVDWFIQLLNRRKHAGKAMLAIHRASTTSSLRGG